MIIFLTSALNVAGRTFFSHDQFAGLAVAQKLTLGRYSRTRTIMDECCDDNEPYPLEEQFLDAARSNDVPALEQIVNYAQETGMDLDSIINARHPRSGACALHMVAANGHYDATVYLLTKCSPSPRYQINNNGNSPLHWAVQNKRWAVAKLLLEAYSTEIDVLAKNEFGRSVVSDALNNQPPPASDLKAADSSSCTTGVTPHSCSPDSTSHHATLKSSTNTEQTLPTLSDEDLLVSQVLQLILEHPSAEALEPSDSAT